LAKTAVDLEEFNREVADKFEKADGELSLNRLQIYTKDIGISAYVENWWQEIENRNKQQISKEVFQQLSELNEELRIKEEKVENHKLECEQWEQELNQREQDIQDMYEGEC